MNEYILDIENRLKRIGLLVLFFTLAAFVVVGELGSGVPTVSDVLYGNELIIYQLWSWAFLVFIVLDAGILGILLFIKRLKLEKSLQEK